MTNVSTLGPNDRLLVLAGNETQYRGYIVELASRGILLGDRITRIVTTADLRGRHGPGLYYIVIGTWTSIDNPGLLPALRQADIQRLEPWTL